MKNFTFLLASLLFLAFNNINAQIPDDIDGLICRFDASDLENGAIEVWADRSGNDYDAINDALDKPVVEDGFLLFNNSTLAVDFDGQVYDNPYTKFFVIQIDEGNNIMDGLTYDFEESGRPTSRIRMLNFGDVLLLTDSNWDNRIETKFDMSSLMVVTLIFDSDQNEIRINGETKVSGGFTDVPNPGFRLGSQWDLKNPFTGKIGEMIAFDGRLAPEDIEAIEEYLKLKWIDVYESAVDLPVVAFESIFYWPIPEGGLHLDNLGTTGSHFEFTFTGTDIELIGKMETWGGIGMIFLNGEYVQNVSFRGPPKHNHVFLELNDLPLDTYTVRLEVKVLWNYLTSIRYNDGTEWKTVSYNDPAIEHTFLEHSGGWLESITEGYGWGGPWGSAIGDGSVEVLDPSLFIDGLRSFEYRARVNGPVEIFRPLSMTWPDEPGREYWISMYTQRIDNMAPDDASFAGLALFNDDKELFSMGKPWYDNHHGLHGANNVWSSTDDPTDSLVRLVAKLVMNGPGIPDSVYAWVNPSPYVEPHIATAQARTIANSVGGFNRIRLAAGGDPAPSMYIDEIYISESYHQTYTLTEYLLDLKMTPPRGTLSGAGYYLPGQEAQITAIPNAGWEFVNWLDSLDNVISIDREINITIAARDQVITAVFQRQHFDLLLDVNPEDAGTVSGEGRYTANTDVEVIAVPNDGFRFLNWSHGENVINTDSLFTFTMPDSSVTLIANFEIISMVGDDIFRDVFLYPNPVRDNLIISNLPGNTIINVSNIHGQEILRKLVFSSRLDLDISSLEGGVYFIHITHRDNDHRSIFKFLKK